MRKRTIMLIAFTLFPFLGHGFDVDATDPLQVILLECRHPDGPSQEDDLRFFAKSEGLSNAEMSGKLVALARVGLGKNTDALQRQLAYSALGGLVFFGGEAENAFVREIMRTTGDTTMRHIAVRVGIRMIPGKWEEWVREAAADKRFDDLTRFDAYEEAFRIGQQGDEETRKHVARVLSELEGKDVYRGNQDSLRQWVEELQER